MNVIILFLEDTSEITDILRLKPLNCLPRESFAFTESLILNYIISN